MKIKLTLFSLIILSGCAVITKGEAFPEMYIEKPVSILVLPPINESCKRILQYHNCGASIFCRILRLSNWSDKWDS